MFGRGLKTLSFLTVVLLVGAFALARNSVDVDLAAGVLWVTLLFAAVLGIGRLFMAESDQGGFDGFLLAPVDRTAMLVAKAAVLLVFLVAVLLIADAGIAVVGTMVGASPAPRPWRFIAAMRSMPP